MHNYAEEQLMVSRCMINTQLNQITSLNISLYAYTYQRTTCVQFLYIRSYSRKLFLCLVLVYTQLHQKTILVSSSSICIATPENYLCLVRVYTQAHHKTILVSSSCIYKYAATPENYSCVQSLYIHSTPENYCIQFLYIHSNTIKLLLCLVLVYTSLHQRTTLQMEDHYLNYTVIRDSPIF